MDILMGKDLHDMLVEIIEIEANNPYRDEKEIRRLLAEKIGFTERNLSEAFKYVTGLTLAAYIKERKINAAYKCLCEENNRQNAMNKATALSGYSGDSKLCNAFRKKYGMSRYQAYIKKDKTKITQPLTWEAITSKHGDKLVADVGLNVECNSVVDEEETIFGITRSQYEKVKEVLDLKAYYGLDEMFCELAYDLSEKTNRTLNNTFEFADCLREYGGDYGCCEEDDVEYRNMTPKQRLGIAGNNPYYQFMFFECNVLPADADIMELRLPYDTNDILLLNPEEIQEFSRVLHTDLSFKFFQKAYRYYKDHADDDYDELCYEKYIELLECHVPIEVAFEAALEDVLIDKAIDELALSNGTDIDRIRSYDYEREFADEKWIESETVWNEPRFDEEIDINNYEYIE